MLILSRTLNQELKIGDDITVTVVEIRGNYVKLGIDAPEDVQIVRGDAINKEPRK